jgi:hypothetical protein
MPNFVDQQGSIEGIHLHFIHHDLLIVPYKVAGRLLAQAAGLVVRGTHG